MGARSAARYPRSMMGGTIDSEWPAPAPEAESADEMHPAHAIATASDGFIVVDHRGRIVFANPYVSELFGYAPLELVGEPLETLVPAHQREEHSAARQRFADRPAERRMGRRLVCGRRKDGSLVSLEVRLSPWSDGDEPYVTAVVRNTSERDREQVDLAMRDRMASVGRLTATLLHELNNPLAVVLANLEFLANRTTAHPDDPTRNAIDDAMMGADRMRDLLRDLKPLSTPWHDPLTPIRLDEVACRALRLLPPTLFLHAPVERGIDDELPPVFGSEGRLLQVFTNLLVNAGHALQEVPASKRRARLSVRAGELRVECVIEDSGPGIPEHLLPCIFTPYFTTRPHGSGLGLAIANQIVTSFGGTMSAGRSSLGGAAFRFSLPALVGA